LSDGQLLILRSTVYPGTTDWLDNYLKRIGRKNKIAFCPNVSCRVGIKELREMPQIVTAPHRSRAGGRRVVPPDFTRGLTVKPLEAEFATC